jgi:N-succinyldiaminopimelate aminotransferase
MGLPTLAKDDPAVRSGARPDVSWHRGRPARGGSIARVTAEDLHLTSRLRGHATTIFAEMSALAVATGSINLGQGFPDTDGPPEIAESAVRAILEGHNQYPPGPGIPELRRAVAQHQQEFYGLEVDPDDEVLVTVGATEAIAASLLGLCSPGDEVVMFEPFYDSYPACVAMAGASPRFVTLRGADNTFDRDELESAVTPRTRLVLLNTPHNPTGKVFTDEELTVVARTCVEHDLLAVTDEVYEHMVFDGVHRPLAGYPGMRERTVTISSAGKTYSFTGWKVGWACAAAPVLAAVRAAKQFLTYAAGTPFQHAVADALRAGRRLTDGVAPGLRARRDLLCEGLSGLGLQVRVPAGTYFATTDISPISGDDGIEFCRRLPGRCGVVAIPSSVFYARSGEGRTLVRWTFCKRPEVLREALSRLEILRG